jgi:2-desacetyl-2-hydroxyethyl bacteriochlorophyllide A dehydrogenase
MAIRIVFPEPRRVALESFDPPPVERGMVAVRARYTLMSAGTENIIFNRRYAPGTHWDAWVRYPMYPGYAGVGEVVEAGPDVDDLTPGTVVAARFTHASDHVVSAQQCVAVPEHIDTAAVPWFALAKIAFMGARAGGYRLGSRVLVVGAGPIGQMSVRWASAAGARAVIAVDTERQRLALATAGGATAIVALPAGECRAEIERLTGGALADVVVDSTGSADVFAHCLGLAAHGGKVVVLGDTGSPAEQHLTSDVITQGLSIVGAHDSHSMLVPAWDGDRSIHELFFDLVTSGRFNLGGLNTHTFEPSARAEAYALANERLGDTMGILFDWSQA